MLDEAEESEDASVEFDVSVESLVVAAGFLDVVEDELDVEDDPPDEEDVVG